MNKTRDYWGYKIVLEFKAKDSKLLVASGGVTMEISAPRACHVFLCI